MFRWFKYLTAIPQLIGLVTGLLDLVRHAEDLVSGGAKGGQKKALVLTLLDSAIGLGHSLGIPEADKIDRQALKDTAGGVIDTLVSVLNSVGVFKHGQPAQPVQ